VPRDEFYKVVIRDKTMEQGNIHLAVHPFPVPHILMMMGKGNYTDHYGCSLPDWQRKLADELWDKLPGLQDLFFNNGEITIQHNGLFRDSEIREAAIKIIEPYLEEQFLNTPPAKSVFATLDTGDRYEPRLRFWRTVRSADEDTR